VVIFSYAKSSDHLGPQKHASVDVCLYIARSHVFPYELNVAPIYREGCEREVNGVALRWYNVCVTHVQRANNHGFDSTTVPSRILPG